MMRLKMIACEVLTREICWSAARSANVIDLEFTPKDAHENSNQLRKIIQEKIDATPENSFDAILLGYGLCGNSTAGLIARHTPLVIPRAHDCCTLFLGSRLKFEEYFSENPSQPFTSIGYMERGDSYIHTSEIGKTLGLDRTYEEYVSLYGEENAKYIMETLHPAFNLSAHEEKVVFIRIPETENLEWVERFQKKAQEDGKGFVQLDGSIDLIRNLIDGKWSTDEYLIVPPGHQIEGVYDWEEICRIDRVEEGE